MAFEEIQNNQGRVYKDKHLAVYRDPSGQLHQFSSLCTHDECTIAWNDQAKEWDCPCHGSRFTADGHVITGPAVEPLTPFGTDE